MFSVLLAVIFICALVLVYLTNYIHQNVAFTYISISIITIIVYAHDKSKARRGLWRTKESTLHLLALLGGWPGAAIAQQILRHKSQKRAFRNRYWLTVIMNSSTLGWLIAYKYF
jgi:uncharacterized membrane protein YsdA (DUF1294 family)